MLAYDSGGRLLKKITNMSRFLVHTINPIFSIFHGLIVWYKSFVLHEKYVKYIERLFRSKNWNPSAYDQMNLDNQFLLEKLTRKSILASSPNIVQISN